MIFSLVILSTLLINVSTVSAQDANYTITSVNHQIEVMRSGQIVIRDTIQVTGDLTGGFLIGLPYKYAAHLLKTVAYDSNNVYPLTLGVQLADKIGFYGVKVTFPQANPQTFTVAFVFSNSLLSEVFTGTVGGGTTNFNLDFPAYPAFVNDVGSCKGRKHGGYCRFRSNNI